MTASVTGYAKFTGNGVYRTRLERFFDQPGPTVAILGVNPSTADAEKNDHTIRKDLGFGRRLGWGKLIKGNKFAFRATDVKQLALVADPIGPGNDAELESICWDADIVIAAWGPLSKLPAELRTRWRRVVEIALSVGHDELMCFGTAKDGQPLHTLTLAYVTALRPWKIPT